MQDPEPRQTLADLGRDHGTSIIAYHCTRQASLLESLRQAVGDILGVLRQIPLQMTGNPRAVVERAEQDRCNQLAARGDHLARTMVAVKMEEAADILGLEASYLAIEQPGLGTFRAFCPARREAPPLDQAIGLEEPTQSSVGRQRIQIGIGLGSRDEIVVMQLLGPALVRGILVDDDLTCRAADGRLLAGIGAQLAPQHRDGIVTLNGVIEPPFDRGEREADTLTCDGVTPLTFGQRLDLFVQLALRGRRSQ